MCRDRVQSLELSSATINLNGRYTIVLSNATGLIFTRPAVVRVFDWPIITSTLTLNPSPR